MTYFNPTQKVEVIPCKSFKEAIKKRDARIDGRVIDYTNFDVPEGDDCNILMKHNFIRDEVDDEYASKHLMTTSWVSYWSPIAVFECIKNAIAIGRIDGLEIDKLRFCECKPKSNDQKDFYNYYVSDVGNFPWGCAKYYIYADRVSHLLLNTVTPKTLHRLLKKRSVTGRIYVVTKGFNKDDLRLLDVITNAKT